MIAWSDPFPLHAYRQTLRTPGVYIIGGTADPRVPVVGCGEDDPYLGHNWPDNFVPHYVGISESKNIGVRGRLRSHRRRKGNKGIAARLGRGEELYFIFAYGAELITYESAYLCLKSSTQFSDNVRSEFDRDAHRRYRRIREQMTPFDRDYYDHFDFDGREL
jgi:hypothetical protein